MARKDKPKGSKMVGMLTDPLNWALLILASAFAYYVMMVPYWQNLYLKEDPQVMTLQEYMDNPSHPREWMLRTLGAPPSSIEIIIDGLTVKHIDTDSIMLSNSGTSTRGAGGPCDEPPMIGSEQPAPLTEILVAGDNMDLLELSEGQQVSLQIFGLYETDLGWVPLEPVLESGLDEKFSKEELDALEFLRIHANGNTIEVPYLKTGELRLAAGLQPAGEPGNLEELADDSTYIQTVNRLAGASLDLQGLRLVDWDQQSLQPYFIVEDNEGRRARVFYNQRLLSEWRWGLDRLEGQCVVVRGVLQSKSPPELRQLDADGNIQVMIDGHAIIAADGAIVISLENPAAALIGSGS
ncbi:MAG: hypothetical protein IH849_14315 [Acidobacteria bacterium]|nr:hypothetical protein [Acidobacteriota bacterium]